MSKLTLADTRAVMAVAWSKAREAAEKFGGRASEYFRKALEHAYEAARAAADRLAYEMMSPGEKLAYQVADRTMRVDYIDDHFQHREELRQIGLLEAEAKALKAAEDTALEDMATYAAELAGPVYRPAPKLSPAFAMAIAATASPVDANTRVDLRGICGERRFAA